MKEVEVEVLVDSFKDNEAYNNVTKVLRNGEVRELQQKVFLKGDRYKTSLDRASYLESIKYVKIVNNNTKLSNEDK